MYETISQKILMIVIFLEICTVQNLNVVVAPVPFFSIMLRALET